MRRKQLRHALDAIRSRVTPEEMDRLDNVFSSMCAVREPDGTESRRPYHGGEYQSELMTRTPRLQSL